MSSATVFMCETTATVGGLSKPSDMLWSIFADSLRSSRDRPSQESVRAQTSCGQWGEAVLATQKETPRTFGDLQLRLDEVMQW